MKIIDIVNKGAKGILEDKLKFIYNEKIFKYNKKKNILESNDMKIPIELFNEEVEIEENKVKEETITIETHDLEILKKWHNELTELYLETNRKETNQRNAIFYAMQVLERQIEQKSKSSNKLNK